jgi:predicted MFS family arabinose efflux permease
MRRLVALVGAVILVDTMYYAAITPLLPELARELELGKHGAGVLTGAYAVGTLVGSLPAGWLIARAGVRPTMVVGLALMSVSGLAFAFGRDVAVLDGARFLQGVGGACCWATGMAWLAAVAPRERRGQVLGSAIGVAIFGVQLGPVLGAVATWVGREAAFSSAVLFGLALGCWALTTPGRPAATGAIASPLVALRDRGMLAGMWLTALPSAAFGVITVLAPLRLDALGASGLALGATFFAAAGFEALVSPLVGRFTDRRGLGGLVPAVLAASGAMLVVLQLPGSAPVLAVVLVGVMGVLGALWVPAMGVLAGRAEEIGLDHGFASAFFTFSWAAGFAVGSVAGGGLAEVSSDVVPYALVAGLYAVSAIWAVSRRGVRTGGVRRRAARAPVEADRAARYGSPP